MRAKTLRKAIRVSEMRIARKRTGAPKCGSAEDMNESCCMCEIVVTTQSFGHATRAAVTRLKRASEHRSHNVQMELKQRRGLKCLAFSNTNAPHVAHFTTVSLMRSEITCHVPAVRSVALKLLGISCMRGLKEVHTLWRAD